MAVDPCLDKRLLIQADIDGELNAATAAPLVEHLSTCAGCAAWRAEILDLRRRLRDAEPLASAPAGLRARVEAMLDAPPAATVSFRPAPRRAPWGIGVAFAGGLALAASVALVIAPGQPEVAGLSLLDSHLRALQPGHLTDVVSSDRHTVKPWFDGKTDFAPPVRDLGSDGFPLLGGRLDRLEGRTAAVLTYGRRAHVIDVYVWPTKTGAVGPAVAVEQGYGIRRWVEGGLGFAAIADLEAAELDRFVALFKGGA